jgi:hypothetical protein
MSIIDAVRDHKVFAQHFRGESWGAWLTFLRALFALPMSDDQLAIYKTTHRPQLAADSAIT